MATEIAILALTEGGRQLAERLGSQLPGSCVFYCRKGLQQAMYECWQEYEGLVCIMAAGIVVRMLAPLLKDKRSDPSVVVCDEKGQFAISLLSGHLGGGNELARQVAAVLDGQAVITTASDVLGRTAIDLWAHDLELTVADRKAMTRVMGKLASEGVVSLYSDYPVPDLPPDMKMEEQSAEADLVVTSRTDMQTKGTLLHPRVLTVGIGCNRNTPAEEIDQAFLKAMEMSKLAIQSVRSVASIDLKSDERGLLDFVRSRGYTIDFYTRDQLNGVNGISFSAPVFNATGAKGVAEPAAVLSAGGGRLLVRKMKWPNVTVAIAEMVDPLKTGQS